MGYKSNAFIISQSQETGVPVDTLNSLWERCEQIVHNTDKELQTTDPKFTTEVMKLFKEEIKLLDIHKAKEIVMAREEFTRHGQDWLNALATQNYVAAQGSFPKIMDAKVRSMINTKKEDVLKRFAEKIKEQNKG